MTQKPDTLTGQTLDFTKITREACVETIDEALKAQELGADRIELCSRLDLDGLTPPDEMIMAAQKVLNIPVKVMIRPREGDFVYDSGEIETMLKSIDFCKTQKVAGVVFGVLDVGNELDLAAVKLLASHAAPMHVTIHKAIDETNDPVEAIKQLRSLGTVHAVLTSGKAATAENGQEMIKAMMQTAGESLTIIVAGKVKYDNLESLHQKINAREYHGKRIVGQLKPGTT